LRLTVFFDSRRLTGKNRKGVAMRKALTLLFCLVLFLPSLQAVQKQKKDKNSAIVFFPDDRRAINEYFRNTSNLPPGLAKRGGDLPPGLQKHLQRNGQLPPGLEKRLTPFPDDLDRRLPRLPSIYRRGTIGDNAIIYEPATNRIVDIIQLFTGTR
jgi:hypothetical protein